MGVSLGKVGEREEGGSGWGGGVHCGRGSEPTTSVGMGILFRCENGLLAGLEGLDGC